MKKYLITFLGVIFLLPAFAYAGSYCVSFPDYGESRWAKRDNTAGIRFRYDYERKKATAGKPVAHSFEPDFFAQLVSLVSQEGQVIGKVITLNYWNRTRDLCLDGARARLGSVSYIYNKSAFLEDGYAKIRDAIAIKVRLDVKWGGDCETVYLDDNGISGDHRFQLYRRRGDLVNPWGCRRK